MRESSHQSLLMRVEPAYMLKRHSSLESLISHGGRDSATGARAVQITQVQNWHLGLFAAYPGGGLDYEAALTQGFGVKPTRSPHISQELTTGTMLCVAPGQHWVISQTADLLEKTAQGLGSTGGTYTSLSHSRVRVAIIGPQATRVLDRGISLDLHPEAFGVGHFAQTALHHCGIVLHRTGEHRYELYLPRTYAVSLWEWLVDAAWPLGYDTAIEALGAVGNSPS